MDKKFTAQEAAIAVLKKAEEMYKSSKMSKAVMAKDDGGLGQAPMAQAEQNVTPVDGIVAEPEAIAPHGTQNPAPVGKGVHKLAKFMGRKEEKAKHAPKEQAHDASMQTPPQPATQADPMEKAKK